MATDALAAGILIGEAVGLFAERLHGTGPVLFCDNAERIVDGDQAKLITQSATEPNV